MKIAIYIKIHFLIRKYTRSKSKHRSYFDNASASRAKGGYKKFVSLSWCKRFYTYLSGNNNKVNSYNENKPT